MDWECAFLNNLWNYIPIQTFCTGLMKCTIGGFIAVSFFKLAKIGLVQFVLIGRKHVQSLRPADEKIAHQSLFSLGL